MSDWSKSRLSIFTGTESTTSRRSGPRPAPSGPDKGQALVDEATVMAVSPELAEVMAKEAAVPEQWEVGKVILDLYEVKGQLGSGGMGQVYRVRHISWNADLAVKTPRPEIFSQAGVKEIFVSEAETWVNLGLHAHVVCCYYVRTLGGIPRVFVEYVEGGSLSDWIRDRKLYAGGQAAALERILDISIQFAWGLRFAHQQGLVHQDMKPANVMMTAEGVAKVTDFGLARAIGAVETAGGNSDAAENLPINVAGMTPAYCSPEQAGGEIVSLKTDIWSWAVSVLEMFTGGVTWGAGQVAGAALEEYLENGAGDDLIPRMPAPLAELLRRSFRMEPSERPEDMDEVVETLRAIYREVTGRDHARPQPRAGQGTADSLNNRALSLLDLGKVKEAEAAWEAALAADLKHPETTFNYGVLRWRRGELSDAALAQQLESVRALHPEDWRIDYFFSLFHLERGDIRASLWFLEAASRKSPESVELQKALELARSGKVSGNTPVRDLATRAGLLDACMFSSDGERMLTIGAGGVMRLWETASGNCLQTKENHAPVMFASLSGDGRLAFTGDVSRAELWDSSTGEALRVSRFGSEDAALARRLTEPDPESRKGFLLNAVKTQLLLRVALPLFFLMVFSGLFTILGALVLVLLSSLFVSWYYKDRERTRDWFMRERAHIFFIQRACLTRDGAHVLTWNAHRGMNFETLKYWDARTGECLYTLEDIRGERTTFGPRRGTGFMDQPAGWVLRLLAPQGTPQVMAFWNWARPKTQAEEAAALDMNSLRLPGQGQTGRVLAQFLSADGRYALTGSDDNRVRLYDLNERRRRRVFAGHYGAVTAVCLSEDGRSVLSGGEDASVRVWDVASGRCLKVFNGHADRVTSVCFSHDARYALSGSLDRTLRLWDAKTGCCLRVFAGHSDQVLSAGLSSGGRFALSAGTSASLLLWDIPQPNGELFPAQMSRVRATAEVIEYEGQVRDLLERGEAAMQGAVFNDALALVERARQTPGFERMRQNLEEWEKLSLYCQRVGVRSTWPAKILEHHTSSISAVCLSGDGRYAFSGSHAGKFGAGSGTLRLWDVYEGRSLKEFKYGGTVYCVGLSANGEWGASGGADGEVLLWDFRKGRYRRSFSGHSGAVTGVAISGDGRYVLSCGEDRTLRLWDADSGNCLRVTGVRAWLYSVRLSSTGRYAVSGDGDGLVRLWELASGRCLLTMKGHGPGVRDEGCCVYSVCISNDEQFAISGSADQTIRLWRLATGECVRVFSGHTGAVTSVCFSSDGSYALSGCADKTLRLWEVETGRCLRVLEGHTEPVTSAALTPNARYAFSGGCDGTLRVWEIDWELKSRAPADWDEGARPFLEAFLLTHTPPRAEMTVHRPPSQGEIKHALTREGKPSWNEEDFRLLIRQLQYAGYGWLRPEGVEAKLKELTAEWRQPPPLVEKAQGALDNLPLYLSTRFYHYKRALRPYAKLLAIGGVAAAMALLYSVCSSTGSSNYRVPYGGYRVYDGPGVVYPQRQTFPDAPPDVQWSTYMPGGHTLSVELPRPPGIIPDVMASDKQLASAEAYEADIPASDLTIRMLRLEGVMRVRETPKLLLPAFLKSFSNGYGGVLGSYQMKPRTGGGTIATGTFDKNGTRGFFKALVLTRDREVWFIVVLRENPYGGEEAESAMQRVISSVRF